MITDNKELTPQEKADSRALTIIKSVRNIQNKFNISELLALHIINEEKERRIKLEKQFQKQK